MKQKRIEFITIGTFVGLPPVKNIFEIFVSFGQIVVLQNTINNFDNFLSSASKSHVIANFSSSQKFNNQSILNKIWKYLYVIIFVFFEWIKRLISNYGRTIYTIDLFTLYLSITFKQKKDIIIYHQFEVLEPSKFNFLDRVIYKLLQNGIINVDLIIIPEFNRGRYFLEIFPNCAEEKLFLLPNTNKNKIEINITNNKSKIRITHVGAVGKEHHLASILKAFSSLSDSNFELYFVGFVNDEVKSMIKSFNLVNVTIIDQVKHWELDEIYKNTDIGIILYKDVSINYKFCAPNKLFEYWSYGIPVIGDILPGLTSLSVDHKIARFVDLDNTEEVINAINDLSKISKIQIQEMFKSKYSFDNYLEKLEFKLKVK